MRDDDRVLSDDESRGDESAGRRREDRPDDTGDGGETQDRSGNVAGGIAPSDTIEPGSPQLSNALFVVFGAILAVLGLGRLFVDTSTLGQEGLIALAAGTLFVSLLLLGFFGLLTPDT